jgi:DNA-binding response OmpR family regulator
MSRLRILLLEDDANLGFILKEHLEMQGYDVDLATNGFEGMARFRCGGFALCLVDVMMPKKDGFTFAKEVRAQDELLPLIFLTARSLKEDRVEGFRIGADDYITKPFSMEELMLRIRAVLKRTHPPAEAVSVNSRYTIGSFSFDAGTRTLSREGSADELTTREAELLTMFCQREHGLLERSAALREIWGDDTFFAGRSMDVFISRLRKRLAADPAVQIVNVHGKGFRLVVSADEAPRASAGITTAPPPRTGVTPRTASRSGTRRPARRKRG